MKLANKNQGNKNNFHFHLKIHQLWCSEQHVVVKKYAFHMSCFFWKYNLEKEWMKTEHVSFCFLPIWECCEDITLIKWKLWSLSPSCLRPNVAKEALCDILIYSWMEIFCIIYPNSQDFLNKTWLLSCPLVLDYKLVKCFLITAATALDITEPK